MRVVIRTNGRGNAWPLELGAHDSRHHSLMCSASEYANTSLSILGYDESDVHHPIWDVLFDVGQGVLPFLVQKGNRLPTAILLSHPHYDHISGLDWLGASNRRNGHSIQLPVYATRDCWRDITQRFPWLSADFMLQPLDYRVPTPIGGVNDLSVTAFPVYHGPYAPGACLILLEYTRNESCVKAILTGDLLCPLIEPNDYPRLQGARIAYVDTNTRFPSPSSGHWSIIQTHPNNNDLWHWIQRQSLGNLLAPHGSAASLPPGIDLHNELCWSIETFIQRIHPQSLALVHYSGHEDGEILTDIGLRQWTRTHFDISNWHIPVPGHEYVFYDDP